MDECPEREATTKLRGDVILAKFLVESLNRKTKVLEIIICLVIIIPLCSYNAYCVFPLSKGRFRRLHVDT